jgi:6-phosphogluconolactonase
VARHPERGSVDWPWVDFWWGDERFVPGGDPERNSRQARVDLLDRLPVNSARVHEMAASDGEHCDVASAASAYAHDLRRSMEPRGPGEPWFDVLMLGIGPDGHCASLFPGRPEIRATANVVGVTDAPKPPPMRISLSLGTLRRAAHVLFVASGEEKAAAVAASVRGNDVDVTPAAGPRGLESTTWYVDEAAARLLP